MPLNLPDSPSEIELNEKTDFQRELKSSNPFLKNSWISALISGIANRLFDNYIVLENVVDESFYDTSSEVFLIRQSSWYGISKNPAAQSSGSIIVTGVAGTSIPSGTSFSSSDGLTFNSSATTTITAKSLTTGFTITSVGTIATIVFDNEHEISPGTSVTVSGSSEPEYNKTFDPDVIDNFTIEYSVSGSPASPATGSITVAYTTAKVDCASEDFSSETNLSGNELVTLSGAISGADSDSYVYISGFSGGADEEITEDLRSRLLNRVRNPISNFNVSAIKEKVFEISGVTRVFVQEVTPDVGQVTIYFTRDNDDDIIPSISQAQEVKDNILTIKPSNTSVDDVIVNPLVAVATTFELTDVVPDTDTMRTAAANSLIEYFRTQTEPEKNVTEDQYRNAIFNTIDLETGERIESFTLVQPSGDIVVSTGQIATIDEVIT